MTWHQKQYLLGSLALIGMLVLATDFLWNVIGLLFGF